MSSYAGVFSNRSFSLFYLGQALNYVGDGLRLIALPLLVFRLTHSALAIGGTLAIELGLFSTFSLIGGSLADRIDRRRLMIVCDFVRCVTIAFIAVGFAMGFLTLWMIYAAIALISIAAAIFVGGQGATIAYLLGKERATPAIGALVSAEQLSNTVLGPLGGALMQFLGPLPALAINAVTYLGSQIAMSAADTFGPDEPGSIPRPSHVVADVRAGFTFLLGDSAMRTVAASSFIFNFFGFVCAAVWIPFLKIDLHASDSAVGLAFGISALGGLGGTWLASHAPSRWRFGQMLVVAYALDGLLFVPVMLTHSLVVLIVFNTLTYGCVLFEITQIVGWRIRITAEDMVGRVTAAARLVALAGTVPGALIGGYLGDHYGPRSAIVFSGIGYLVMALVIVSFSAVRREAR